MEAFSPSNARDAEIMQDLKALKGDTFWRPKDYFDRALELGASFDLLALLVADYYGVRDHPGDDYISRYCLPWVKQMVDKNFDKEEIRLLVVRLCCDGRDDDPNVDLAPYTRHGLINDPTAWEVFDTSESFIALMESIAEKEAPLILQKWKTISYRLGRLCTPQLEPVPPYTQPTWQEEERHKRRHQEIVEAGFETGKAIFTKAALNVWRVHDDESLEAIKRLSPSAQITAAKRHTVDHRGCILRGYVLAQHSIRQRDGQDILDAVYKYLYNKHAGDGRTDGGIIYRWFLEGAARASKLDMAPFIWAFQELKQTLQSPHIGWKFGRAEMHENPKRPGQRDLQVVTEGRNGWKIVYKHDNQGGRHDVVKEGDEVIVPARPPEEWQPVYEDDRGKIVIFLTELHPVKPPTPEMKKNDACVHFYLRREK